MNRETALKIFAPFDNIIFDFGGVFVDLDFNRTFQAFSKLNQKIDLSNLFSKKAQTEIFNLFEIGRISKVEFLKGLKQILDLNHVEDQNVIDAWCAMLLELRPERVDFLKEISQTKKIFLLSNINQIHEEHIAASFKQHLHLKEFYTLFEKVYFSHHLGMRKPDEATFAHVCKDSSLDVKKTIFVDDSIQHIEGAAKFGLSTYFLDPSNSFIVGTKDR